MKVAVSLSLTGMNAGREVIHREVKGDQLWTVKLDIVSANGDRHESQIVVPERLPLPALAEKANQLLQEFVAEHGNVIFSGKWTARFAPNPAQRKKPKQAKRR